MNKEIKFRVWWKTINRWEEDMVISSNGKLSRYDFELCGVDPNEYTIQQFTGLSDKNGKEIYEGDIVEMLVDTKPYKRNIEVKFEYGCFLPHRFQIGWFCSIECVLGNIFENPELLNK